MAKISAHGEYKRFELGSLLVMLCQDGVFLVKLNEVGCSWKRAATPKVEGDLDAFWKVYQQNKHKKLGNVVRDFNALPKTSGKPIEILSE